MMLKGFGGNETSSPTSEIHVSRKTHGVDRDYLQPHFDVNRFGKVSEPHSENYRIDQPDDRSEKPADNQQSNQWLLPLISDMLLSADSKSCLKAAGDGLRQQWQASYVLVAHASRGLNIDDVMPIGMPGATGLIELRDAIHGAMLETVLTGRIHQGTVSTINEERSPTGCGYAVQRLADQLHGCASFVSFPLSTSDGRCIGALFVAWSRFDASIRIQSWSDVAHWINPIADVIQARITPQPRFTETVAQYLQRRFPVRRTFLLMLLVIGLIGLGSVPTAYPIRAKVTVEPDQRRWISAPFDAPLKRAHVHPGDHVTVGQQLFSLDCEDYLNKLAALKAEANKHASERTTYLAAARLGEAAISSAQLKRVESEIELIYRYLDRSEIRSPVDGVLMGQDLQRFEGSQLKQGQGLIEIAPLSSLHLKAEIPTDQIAHVVTGNTVTATIDSVGRLSSCKLTRVHSRAEANAQGRYVFEGLVDIGDQDKVLMPGMSGYATLHGPATSLAWCWFQHLWQRVRSWSEPT